MNMYAHIGKKNLPIGRGFTLVELLVSVALFSIVMTMALGALLSLSVANRKAQTLKSAIDNLTFSLDSISRSVRTGSGYGCGLGQGVDCPNGGIQIAFNPAGGGPRVAYRFEQSSACGQPVGSVGCITRSTDVGATWVAVTSPEVYITSLSFYTIGTAAGSADNIQPRVIVALSGTVQVSVNQTTTFRMQTTITQRIYDQ